MKSLILGAVVVLSALPAMASHSSAPSPLYGVWQMHMNAEGFDVTTVMTIKEDQTKLIVTCGWENESATISAKVKSQVVGNKVYMGAAHVHSCKVN